MLGGLHVLWKYVRKRRMPDYFWRSCTARPAHQSLPRVSRTYCSDLIGFGTAGKAVLTSGDPKQDKSFEIRAART
jgi:hypothetical protein